MGGVLTYRHEDGMSFDEILDDLIVGSCPQTPEDIDRQALPPHGTSSVSPAWPDCTQLTML